MAAAALETVEVLPAHVDVEAYPVLTRLPAGLTVSPVAAAVSRLRLLTLDSRAQATYLRLGVSFVVID